MLDQFSAAMADHYDDDLEWECIVQAALDETGFRLSRPQPTPAGEIVERLRAYARKTFDVGFVEEAECYDKAASLIEQQAATIAELREQVEPLLRYHETGGHEGDGSDERLAIIRATLERRGQ
jgi:hypothetical protein